MKWEKDARGSYETTALPIPSGRRFYAVFREGRNWRASFVDSDTPVTLIRDAVGTKAEMFAACETHYATTAHKGEGEGEMLAPITKEVETEMLAKSKHGGAYDAALNSVVETGNPVAETFTDDADGKKTAAKLVNTLRGIVARKGLALTVIKAGNAVIVRAGKTETRKRAKKAKKA